jgi:hypothetical protein
MGVRQVYLSCVLQYVAIFVGISWGWTAHANNDLAFWPLTAMLALGLIGTGCVKSRTRRPAFLLYASLMVYTLATFIFDPFLFVDDEGSALVAVALVMPFLFWIRRALRRREALAVWGAILFLTSSVAAMTYNALSVMSGIGLWGGWVS